MKTYDITIIGNGILSLSIALALCLKEPSLRICIIGPKTRLGAATFAAGAMLGCFGEITDATMKNKYGEKKFEMAYKSRALWNDWLNQLNEISATKKLAINYGTIIANNAKSGKIDDKNFNTIINTLQSRGEPFSILSSSDIAEINPTEDARPIRSIYLPKEGYINPFELIQSMESALQQFDNVHLINSFVSHIETKANQIDFLVTDQYEKFQSSHYILAAGSFSKELIEGMPVLYESIPMMLYGTGTSILISSETKRKKNVFRSPNRAGACGMHVVPYDENHLFVGATNNLSLLPAYKPKTRDVYYLLERAIEQYDKSLYEHYIERWFVGNRPVTVDTFPLLGKTTLKNLWISTGTYRDGIHDSPYLAEIISEAILENKNFEEFEIFNPVRNPISISNVNDSIMDFTEQMISASYVHGIYLPKFGVEQRLVDTWKNRCAAIYELLDIDFSIPTDLLIMMDHDFSCIDYFKTYYRNIVKSRTALLT